MRYIRTKAGEIYDIEDLYVCEELNGKPYGVKDSGWVIYQESIIKQSDTIEELCDEFVDVDNHDYYKISHEDGFTFALSKTQRFCGRYDIRLKQIGQIMGAIYTDEGLIYVAKMNEKGELELL